MLRLNNALCRTEVGIPNDACEIKKSYNNNKYNNNKYNNNFTLIIAIIVITQ